MPDSIDIKGIISGNVRRIRLERGLTLDAVAKAGDMHLRYLIKVESGGQNVTAEVLAKLARGLGVAPAELLATESLAVPKPTKKTMKPSEALAYAVEVLNSFKSMVD